MVVITAACANCGCFRGAFGCDLAPLDNQTAAVFLFSAAYRRIIFLVGKGSNKLACAFRAAVDSKSAALSNIDAFIKADMSAVA